MNTEEMTLERFTALLETYGADLERWPHEAQAPARALLRRAPQAQRLQAEMAMLDAELSAALPPLDESALPGLKRRIMERATARLPESSLIMRFWRWLLEGPRVADFLLLRPAALAIIPLLFGFTLGMLLPEADPVDGELATELTLLSLTEHYEGLPDVP